MKKRTINGVAIRAVTAALPEHKITENDFALLFGAKEVNRIAASTGIRSIREAKSLHTSDLILAACQNLFKNGVVQPTDIDGLVVVTQTPDEWSPGLGYKVQHELGLSVDCLVLDIVAGCAGYVNALIQCGALINAGSCKKVLLCTGDVTTKLIDDKDRHVRMLFGDGASATLLEPGDNSFEYITGVDGGGNTALGAHIEYGSDPRSSVSALIGRLHMDGTAVMNFALSRVPSTVKALLSSTGLCSKTLDLLVLHQANEFMINYIRRIIGIDSDKVPIDVDGIGNTSSTSIPIVLSRHYAIGTAKAKNVILCGFGAGLSWAAIYVNLENTRAVSPVYVLNSVAPIDNENRPEYVPI